jgi:DNA-binding CsgD family transcriptional regulator
LELQRNICGWVFRVGTSLFVRRVHRLNLLDTLDEAAITLNHKKRILATNRRAESFLATGEHLYVRDKRLLVRGTESTSLTEVMDRVLVSRCAESLCLSLKGAAAVFVTLSPLPVREPKDDHDRVALLLLIGHPDHRRIASVEQLMQIFQLSPAESRLARAIAQGLELEKFALDQGIKMTTVRSQVAAIYTKTSVRRQADLVRLVLSVPSARQYD